jgi:hypothetical protein
VFAVGGICVEYIPKECGRHWPALELGELSRDQVFDISAVLHEVGSTSQNVLFTDR